MRKFSSNVKLLLSQSGIMPFYLVKIELTSGTLYHGTLPYDVTIPGIGTFLSNNNLIEIEPPKLSNVVDREAYKLTYTDPSFFFKDKFDSGAVGTLVTVYAGFFNTSGGALGGVPPGAPLTDQNDIVVAYRGVLDSHGYSVQDDKVTVSIECSSPMADLDLARAFNTDKQSMKTVNENDSAFDQVFEGSGAVNLLWGKVG